VKKPSLRHVIVCVTSDIYAHGRVYERSGSGLSNSGLFEGEVWFRVFKVGSHWQVGWSCCLLSGGLKDGGVIIIELVSGIIWEFS